MIFYLISAKKEGENMYDRKIKICLKTVNNASLFVAKCGEYKDWDINYIHGRLVLDAKSLMGVLSVAIDAPAYVEILTDDEKVLEDFRNNMKLWEV